MPLVRTQALILHSFPYGDTSRILRLLTPDYGVRSLIAKGARSTRSRFGAVLEPFTEGEAHFNLRDHRDLLTLSGFTLLRSRQGIGQDLIAFTGASLAAELVLRFATDEAQPELYAALSSALDSLTMREHDPTGASLAAIWNLVRVFGFQPSVDTCVHCGRPLQPEEDSRFDADLGGVVCRACRTGRRFVSAPVRHELQLMCTGAEFSRPPADSATHAAILDAFLSAHVLHGRPLRSLPLFLQLLTTP